MTLTYEENKTQWDRKTNNKGERGTIRQENEECCTFQKHNGQMDGRTWVRERETRQREFVKIQANGLKPIFDSSGVSCCSRVLIGCAQICVVTLFIYFVFRKW